MDQLVERCAGLDVHRDTVVATVRRPRSGGGRAAKTLTFSTTTAELIALGDWLVAEEVDLVGMESTGVYWKPVYFLLEQRIPQVWLLNAEHLHNVPGRKTDVADSAWIAQLLEHGLVAPSFVPPAPIRELRDLTRHRRVLIAERTRVIQRLEKVLQDAGIKLSSVASTLLTKSGRAILDALLAGISDPAELAELAKGRLRAKMPALREALAGEFRVAHHGILVAQMLAHVDFLEDSLADLDARIEAAVTDYEPVLQRVVTIPGVARKTALSLLAESGSPVRCRTGAPSEPCVRLLDAHGSSKPRGRCGLKCRHPALAGVQLAAAGGVDQAGSVPILRALLVVVDEVFGGDRPACHALPPAFPVRGGLGLVGAEQVVTAERAASVLPGEQAQVVAVQRGFDPPPPGGPVVDQVRIVRGRRAGDHLVSDDGGPAELDQVRDAAALVGTGAVAEHPSVVSEPVEPAEIAMDDPPLRLSAVGAFGPPVGELPHVGVQLAENLAGHDSPVIGGPAPDDRGERGDDRRRIRAAQCAHLVSEPFAESLDGRTARCDQQLAVAVAAKVNPRKSNPLGEVHDPRLVLVEGKTPRDQPRGKQRLDLLGLLSGVSAGDQVIGVSDHDRVPGSGVSGMTAGALIPDPRGLLQPVERHVHQQRADHTALGSSLLGRREHPVLNHPGPQPAGDQIPGGERSERGQQS